MRDGTAIEILRETLPDAGITVFQFITHFGDSALLVAVVLACYLFGDKRKGAFVLAVALGALSLTLALKLFFLLPRPPVELHATAAGGYSFPSGHATGSTAVWGVLALTYKVWTRRRRFAAAGLLIALIALSRVVLGVHYLGDVIAGVAVGAAYLAVVFALTGGDPDRTFGIAAVVAAAAVLVSLGSTEIAASSMTCTSSVCAYRDAVTLLGATAGSAIAWLRFSSPVQPENATKKIASIGAGTLLFGAIAYAVFTFEPPLVVTLTANALVFAGIVALPDAFGRIDRRKASS